MIHAAIKKYLKEKGIKEKHIANKIGMKYVLFNAKLNGRSKLSAEEYAAICNALGVSLDLFGKEGVISE